MFMGVRANGAINPALQQLVSGSSHSHPVSTGCLADIKIANRFNGFQLATESQEMLKVRP